MSHFLTRQGAGQLRSWFSQDQRTNRKTREECEEKTKILANACPSFFEGCVLRVKKNTEA
jgi:hypothetical protein